MEKIVIKDEFIKLGQAMKLTGFVDSGLDAKICIQAGEVRVNGEVCMQRGKKLYHGNTFSFHGEEAVIVSNIE